MIWMEDVRQFQPFQQKYNKILIQVKRPHPKGIALSRGRLMMDKACCHSYVKGRKSVGDRVGVVHRKTAMAAKMSVFLRRPRKMMAKAWKISSMMEFMRKYTILMSSKACQRKKKRSAGLPCKRSNRQKWKLNDSSYDSSNRIKLNWF